MRILDRSGHTELNWDESNINEQFDELVARFNSATENATAFDVSGTKPRMLRNFDPDADIVITPVLVGG